MLFQQDGASVHTSRSSKQWLADKGVTMFNDSVWSPNSPDLNPIEHLWPLVSVQLRDHFFSSKEDLWSSLEVAFHAVDRQHTLNLYGSMQRRLVAVSRCSGAHTKY